MKKPHLILPLLNLLCIQFLALNLFAQAPVLSSFSPDNGAVGTLVTITGTNLSSPSSFTIGGQAALVVSNTGTSLVGMVMPGAVSGGISLSTAGGNGAAAGNFTVSNTLHPNSPQSQKLVGSGGANMRMGHSAGISADGTTAILGAWGENGNQGAAFVFIKTAGVWSEQTKLVATDNIGAAYQGYSVSISADGNTAILGGWGDNGNIGAAWIFTRSGTTWTQQSKLVGSGYIGASNQGASVSLSADGNTAIIGGYRDNTNEGAAWIFTRTAGIWTQQGNKLVGTGGTAAANQANSVSISADGNTVLIGAPRDGANKGASWIFVRSGTTWSQQGNKLVGTSSASSLHGDQVALSADGNTAVIGGYQDNSYIGAAWFFKRVGTTWSQQGDKITSGIVKDQFGSAVAISADGNTALIGASGPNALLSALPTNGTGRVYTRKGELWTLEPYTLIGSGGVLAQMGMSAALSADGKTGILGGNPDNNGLGAGWTFTYTPAPVITSISPQSGPVGTLVSITGTNLLNPTALSIGGKTAIAVSNTGTLLVAMIMPDAVTGDLTISTTSGTAISSNRFTVLPTLAPNTQQGTKLVGTGNVGSSREGASIAISADGNTRVVGALFDNGNQGAAWVYNRVNGSWSQQAKLIGLNNIGAARQGGAVTISADGNTIIIGGSADNGNIGAAWVFIRANGVWTEQTKLIATGNIGTSGIGGSVSISADGNTAILGGTSDNTSQGAAWIFTRSKGVWTQKAKLIGTGNTGTAHQGGSVFISADAKTVILGGYSDDANKGAAWIFTQTAGTWTQQGNKLVGTGTADPTAMQGTSVSLNADGNTALIGGSADDNDKGAAWIFTRTGGVWTQQGGKLLANDFIGSANQGYSVTLNADGNLAMVGGYLDNGNIGATWLYTRSAGVWSQQGNKIIGTGNTGNALQGIAIALSSDGKTVSIGGQGDDSNRGASWAFNSLTALPTISSFTPTNTGSSNTVTITGTNLIAVSAVSFGGVNAKTYQVVSPTSITVTVPDEAVSGSVAVIAAGGTASLAGFTFAAPSITSFSPSSGSAGTLLKIIGANLSGLTAFTVGGNNAIIVSNTGTELAALVMPGSNTGLISVSTNGGTTSASGNFTVLRTPYPTTQQGNKLVGTNIVGSAQFAFSIAVSADGNTAAIGAINDNASIGGVWIYTRTGNIWTQQGNKLVGTGNTGVSRQGRSVALSADGNTVLIGGNSDNGQIGAAWVFIRTAGVWAQQGNKLLGTNAMGAAQQGFSVSLSADGNTALVGARYDNSNRGAVWVYTRTNGVWSQQGNKLVATDASLGSIYQGYTSSISADGNTAIVGGYGDNTDQGAAWIYTRTGNVWSQQGNKLVGTGNIGAANQASSVSISADGNTAIIGAPLDNAGQGASWIFTRTGNVWSQEGSKLIGTGNIGAANQGRSVSLSADGNTAIAGAYLDDTNKGANWVYTRQTGVWTQQGTKLLGSAGLSGTQGVSNALSTDGSTLMIGAPFDNTNVGAGWAFIAEPVITSFNPTSAGYGDKVTLTGKNLSPTSISFGGTSATSINSLSINSIEAIVGGGTSGSVALSSPFGNPTLAGFTFLPPVITSFTPTSQSLGNTVTITGTNLTGATAVSFGGTAATSFNVVSSTSVTAVLATGASGTVSITTPGGTATLAGFTFLSSNAELSNLSLSTGVLAPVFNSSTITYTADVPFSTSSLKLTPTKTEANASIKVNGNTVISGNPTADLNLSIGSNIIQIVVTAQEGVTIKTYTLTVTRGKENQTLSFSPIAPKAFAEAPFAVSATGGASGNTILYSSSNTNVASVNGSTITITGVGTTVITATQAGNTNYSTAADVAQTLIVNKAAQVITFAALPAKSFGDAAFTIPATGGASGNAILYSSSNTNVATITGSIVTIKGAGTTVITASQVGNTNYNAAVEVPQTLTVNKAELRITAENKTKEFGKANPSFTVTYQGFVNGDNSGVLINQPVLTTNATLTSAEGNYPITVGSASALNYLISYLEGRLTVSEIPKNPPTNIFLSRTDINENNIIGANLGTFNSIDPDTGNSFTYSLVNGAGSSDNENFSIDGHELNAMKIFDFETKTTYSIRVQTRDQSGLTFEKIFQITINNLDDDPFINQAPTLNPINSQVICYDNNLHQLSLNGISSGPETGQTISLSVSSTNSSLFKSLSINSQTNGTATLSYISENPNGGTAMVSVLIKDNGGTANGGIDQLIRTFSISINPSPSANITSDIGTTFTKGLTARLTASGGTSYTWSNANGIISGQNTATLTIRPSMNTSYIVTVSNSSGCLVQKSISISLKDDFLAAINGNINNIMTPNGDGKNDYLVFQNLEMYPNNNLKIFDKSGRELYAKVNYTNDWDGTYNGIPLAEDTYYYVLDFGPGKTRIKGYVSIVRRR